MSVRSLSVAGRRVGIEGLDGVFEAVARLEPCDEARARAELLARVERLNYVAPGSAPEYEAALWREFRRWRGEPAQGGGSDPLTLQVLGPGCPACERLLTEVRDALAELSLAAELEHVREPSAIQRFGMIAVPALAIDGTVVASGRRPAARRLRELIRAALARREARRDRPGDDR